MATSRRAIRSRCQCCCRPTVGCCGRSPRMPTKPRSAMWSIVSSPSAARTFRQVTESEPFRRKYQPVLQAVGRKAFDQAAADPGGARGARRPAAAAGCGRPRIRVALSRHRRAQQRPQSRRAGRRSHADALAQQRSGRLAARIGIDLQLVGKPAADCRAHPRRGALARGRPRGRGASAGRFSRRCSPIPA